MRKLLLLTFSVSVVLCLFSFGDAQVGANATWRVQKYDLDVTLPQNGERSMTAHAVLTVKNVSASPVGSLTLRISPNAEVSSVKINDATVDFSKAEEKLGSGTMQRIGTRFASVAAGGTVTATVDYKLNVKEN